MHVSPPLNCLINQQMGDWFGGQQVIRFTVLIKYLICCHENYLAWLLSTGFWMMHRADPGILL